MDQIHKPDQNGGSADDSGQPNAATGSPDVAFAIPEVQLIREHAPTDLGEWNLDELQAAVRATQPIQMVVVAFDIRKSTAVMREAVHFVLFASAIGEFVEKAREEIRLAQGWWDKFTGDGLLAYWPYKTGPRQTPAEAANTAFDVCARLLTRFAEVVVPLLRRNSRNFAAGIGLSIGVDAGPTYMVKMAGDLTIVGFPVVGAVRMVAAADSWEIIVNSYLGEFIERRHELFPAVRSIEREYRTTKDFPEQEIYTVRLHGFSPPTS
jgi:class 3 adenylate cyclase